jgi:2-oxoglutarate ferredoxin oxidoreductase subunit delta
MVFSRKGAVSSSTFGPKGSGHSVGPRLPLSPVPGIRRGLVHVNLQRCKGCELCVECCPTGVLQLSNGFNAAGYHYPIVISDECVHCQGCTTICPDFAITVTDASSIPALVSAGVAHDYRRTEAGT